MQKKITQKENMKIHIELEHEKYGISDFSSKSKQFTKSLNFLAAG